MADAPALVVDSVSKSFGAVQAVQKVPFPVERGSLTCLTGPKRAGKSTSSTAPALPPA
jgi:ABC-2 type transport system ATP-binding protein